MSVNTSNAYGKISISDLVIAKVASHTAMVGYGIVEMVSRRFTDSLSELLKKDSGGRGVKVTTSGPRWMPSTSSPSPTGIRAPICP